MDPLEKIRLDLIKINNDKILDLKYVKIICPCCVDILLNSDKLSIHMKSKQHKKYFKKYEEREKDKLNILSNELQIV